MIVLPAEILAVALRNRITGERSIAILGIARGGVLLADALSRILSINHFEILISRKLESPYSENIVIGSIMSKEIAYFDRQMIQSMGISKSS